MSSNYIPNFQFLITFPALYDAEIHIVKGLEGTVRI